MQDQLTYLPVIVIDMPVKQWNELGSYAQVVWKFLFQRATERRRTDRPVFLWADEASNFVTSYDAMFQSTARSSKCATVYLCQNLPMYYAALGGESQGKQAADALLGNLSTKIFHANADVTTNQWAADVIGKRKERLKSLSLPHVSHTLRWSDEQPNATSSISEQWQYKIQPDFFTTLRKGGLSNNLMVDGVIFQTGRLFDGNNYAIQSFRQI